MGGFAKSVFGKPYVFLFIFLALAGMYFYSTATLTGFLLEDRNISVNIAPVALGNIIYLNYSRIVQMYGPQVVYATFENTGSIPYAEHMEIQILLANFTTIATYVDSYVALGLLETRDFQAIYTSGEPGYYWIYVRAFYSDKVADAWGLYYVNGTKPTPPPIVLPPALPPPPSTLKPGTGLGGIGYANMALEYPPNITLNQNQSTLVYVIVKNTGNAVLNNIIFPVTSLGVAIDVTPKIIPELYAGREGIFLISVSASENMTPGTYPIKFYVRADQITYEGQIDVIVKTMPLVDELNMDLLNYAILLKRLRGDAINATLDGKNVTLAVWHIDEGERVLDIARKELAGKNFTATKESLKTVKKHIEDAVLELARARRVTSLYAVFSWLSLLLVLIAIAIAAILIYEHHRKREKMRKEAEGAEAGQGQEQKS